MTRVLWSGSADFSQCCCHLQRLETSGAFSTFVSDLALFIYYVESVWPGSVSLLNFVIHIVYYSRKGQPQIFIAFAGHRHAFFHGLWLVYLDPFIYIGINLPPIGRMGFSYVDEKPF
jgi:hypothetical protein